LLEILTDENVLPKNGKPRPLKKMGGDKQSSTNEPVVQLSHEICVRLGVQAPVPDGSKMEPVAQLQR
jgi:hypothetical protein